ncbi:tape measure protein [Nannocystis sp. ILAH1]|uniref:tape measure protein n=1 Tax=Nannocystis sp. ILAH1 TaxID=2996789 RepID=UPI00226DD32F|nr:tape measure protein [Nannocystis sp. ILAH1]MCY0990625.1 tape measure protein [Nannocystis sp. ILAH1]
MSEETQRIAIDISARTDAAVSEVDKLNKVLRAQTTAAEEGSKAQKGLGKAVKEQRQLQAETADAVRRAKDAQSEHNLVVQAFGPKSKEATDSAKRLAKAQEEVQQSAKRAAAGLQATARAAREAAEAEGEKLSPATRRAAADLDKMSKEAERTASEIRKLDAQLEKATKTAKESSKGFGGLAASFGGNLLASGVGALVGKLGEAGMFAGETAATFERLKTALETTTGSTALANEKFAELQKFAKETPFGLEETTEAFIKLSNRGVNANERLLTSLGNTASAMGKTLDDAVEAMADAITGENERLKEFGIVGKLAGDQVAYTFRGVTTMVKRDAASIAEYLTKIGEVNFAGGMEKQSKTLGGLWSALQDSAAQFVGTLMDSGVSDVLKDIMREVSDLAGGSGELAKELGGALASGLSATYKLLKDLAPMFTLSAKAAAWFFQVISDGIDSMHEYDAQVAQFGRSTEIAHERLKEFAKENGFALGPLAEMTKQTFMNEQAQESLNRAILEGIRMREDQARTEGMIANLMVARSREEAARLADLERRKASAEKAGKMAEYDQLSKDKSLSPSEKKRLRDLKKELDIPDAPKRKKAKKDKTVEKQHDFDADVADFEFELTKDIRKQNLEAEKAANEEAFESEKAIREQRVVGLEREIELLEAKGIRETEQIDLIFGVLEVEDEAEARREELHLAKLDREIELADWEARNALDKETREEAALRAEESRHKKELALLASREKAEQKAARSRIKTIETVQSISGKALEEGLSAAEAAMNEEKDIGLRMLSNLLDAVKQQARIKVLYHAAEAIGAFASYRYVAGAQHLAAAAAWGVLWGGTAAGQAAIAKKIEKNEDAREEAEKKKEEAEKLKKEKADSGSPTSSGGTGGTSRGGDSSIPTSRYDADSWHSRGNQQQMQPREAANHGPTIQIGQLTVLGTTQEEVGIALQKIMTKAQRSAGDKVVRR